MKNNILGLIISFAYIAIIVVSANLFQKAGKEASRKYIHIMLSNWWIIAIIFFDSAIFSSILPAVFIVVNYISYKTNLIKVMERDDKEDNKESLGTVYYAISLFILSILTFGVIDNPFVGLCGILVMGYGDGLAAVIGQSVKSFEYKIGDSKKSVAGSITMFIVALIIVVGYFTYNSTSYIIIKSIVIAMIMTVIEAISIKGTDNLTVPLLTSLLVFLMT